MVSTVYLLAIRGMRSIKLGSEVARGMGRGGGDAAADGAWRDRLFLSDGYLCVKNDY